MPPTGHHAIFLSYRRDDAQANAGRLFDWLARQFGREQILLTPKRSRPAKSFHESSKSDYPQATSF